MKKNLLVAAIGLALMGSALAQNVAIVNGTAIPSSRLDFAMTKVLARNGGAAIPAEQKDGMRKSLSDQLIMQEVLAQEAKRRGLENTPTYKTEMDFAQQSVLVNMLIEDFVNKNKPTDADIKTEYDRVVALSQNTGKEYKARHILVPDEKQAKDIIAQLNKGAKFDVLAKKYSKDPGSAVQGGELGWADPAGYVPEFSDALKALAKGKITQTPVKTSFGYHIIQLEDIRDAEKPKIPPLDQVKDKISQKLLSDKVQAFEKDLRAKAVIK